VLRRKVEVALEAQALPAAAREPLDVALSQLDRAAVTITALLRISAVETSARDKGFRDVTLANVCAEARDFYALGGSQVRRAHRFARDPGMQGCSTLFTKCHCEH